MGRTKTRGDLVSRELVDLIVGLVVAGLVAAVSIGVTFSGQLHAFFLEQSRFRIIDVVINLLLFWLVVVLVVSFRRLRRAASARAELEDIISSISPDALIVVSPDREIVMCNASVERMFGYGPGEVAGRKTDRLYYDRRANLERPHEIYDAIARDGFHVGLANGRRRDGSTFPLEIIAADLSGRAGAVLLLRDISERQEAEARRRQLEKRIQLQQKMESLGILAGGVAHDFNNLLTVIQGNVEILKETCGDVPAAGEFFRAILGATERAAGLCSHMLAYSGKGEFTIESLDLSDLVGKTARLLGVSLSRDVRLHCHLDEHCPAVRGDAVQLQQVVMNLIINATEAIDGEPGDVSVGTGMRWFDEAVLRDQCVVNALSAGRHVFFEVVDNGCGIELDVLERIFDPFFSTKRTGRGMGLATVLGAVRAHRGALRVCSEPGKGSTFTLILPVEPALTSVSEEPVAP